MKKIQCFFEGCTIENDDTQPFVELVEYLKTLDNTMVVVLLVVGIFYSENQKNNYSSLLKQQFPHLTIKWNWGYLKASDEVGFIIETYDEQMNQLDKKELIMKLTDNFPFSAIKTIADFKALCAQFKSSWYETICMFEPSLDSYLDRYVEDILNRSKYGVQLKGSTAKSLHLSASLLSDHHKDKEALVALCYSHALHGNYVEAMVMVEYQLRNASKVQCKKALAIAGCYGSIVSTILHDNGYNSEATIQLMMAVIVSCVIAGYSHRHMEMAAQLAMNALLTKNKLNNTPNDVLLALDINFLINYSDTILSQVDLDAFLEQYCV